MDSHRTIMDSHSQQCMLGIRVKESAIFVEAFIIDITNVLKEIVFYKYYNLFIIAQSSNILDMVILLTELMICLCIT